MNGEENPVSEVIKKIGIIQKREKNGICKKSYWILRNANILYDYTIISGRISYKNYMRQRHIPKQQQSLPETINTAVKKRILTLCKEYNLSVGMLARKCVLSPAALYNLFECAVRCPTLDTIVRICDGLDVPAACFFNKEFEDDVGNFKEP